jgi:hypothetical protein
MTLAESRVIVGESKKQLNEVEELEQKLKYNKHSRFVEGRELWPEGRRFRLDAIGSDYEKKWKPRLKQVEMVVIGNRPATPVEEAVLTIWMIQTWDIEKIGKQIRHIYG